MYMEPTFKITIESFTMLTEPKYVDYAIKSEMKRQNIQENSTYEYKLEFDSNRMIYDVSVYVELIK